MENKKQGFRTASGAEFRHAGEESKTEQVRKKGRWVNKTVVYEVYESEQTTQKVQIKKGELKKYLRSMTCAFMI